MRAGSRLTGGMALGAGYGAILVLLVYSAIEAYGLQGLRSEHQVSAYQHYLQLETSLSELKRYIWLGGGYAREYFLSPASGRDRQYSRQVAEMRAQADAALDRIRVLAPGKVKRWNVDRRVQELLSWLSEMPEHTEPELSALEIVRGEYIPRRIAAFEALEALTKDAQQELHAAEARFAEERSLTARKLIILLIASVMVGLGVAWTTLRYSQRWEYERRLHYEEIERTKQELEQLSARLLDIQEEERRSLSRELHDEVGQTLTALRMEVSQAMASLDESPARERLMRAKDLAERTVRTVRNITLMLRPSILDDLGLEAALHWQVEQFASRSGIKAKFSACDVDENLTDQVKTCVYRITQEALNNCEKYAFAENLSVALKQLPQELILTITDDGVGFSLEESAAGGGTGLFGMRERVSRFGGRIYIDSHPGRGVQLTVSLPLAANPIPSKTEVAA